MLVMYLSKHNEALFLNLCEFVYTPGVIEALLCGHEEEISERVDEEVEISNNPSTIVVELILGNLHLFLSFLILSTRQLILLSSMGILHSVVGVPTLAILPVSLG